MPEYVNNAELAAEIVKTRHSYCFFIADEYAAAAETVDEIDAVTEPGVVYRVNTWEHIPRRRQPDPAVVTAKLRHWHQPVNFRPFVHLVKSGNTRMIVGKSHHGPDGEYGLAGRPTDRFGEMAWQMANNYALRPNFQGYPMLEDMIAEAALKVMEKGVMYDPAVSANAFSYITQLVHQTFIKIIKDAKAEAEDKFAAVRAGMLDSGIRTGSDMRRIRDADWTWSD